MLTVVVFICPLNWSLFMTNYIDINDFVKNAVIWSGSSGSSISSFSSGSSAGSLGQLFKLINAKVLKIHHELNLLAQE